jgi:pimeloyl-ACP methyl ester carboxylesterase
MKTKAFRIISILMLAIIILALGTLIAGAIAKANLAKQYPAPDQLVDVGGYKMHINCTGQGSPTVILEAGSMEFSVNWAKVQPEVARFTRVCSYDRAGFGWSESSPQPRTANAMVKELHTLLVNANIQGPYVLVGHSIGGLLIRVYAHNYPDEVTGLVLVDSTHDEQDIRRSAALPQVAELQKRSFEQMAGQFRLYAFLSSTGLLAFAQQNIPDPGLPDGALAQYRATMVTNRFFETGIVEGNAQEEMLSEVRALHITSFGNMPLIVLSAGRRELDPALSDAVNQQSIEIFKAMQSELAALSSVGKQIVAEQSGHNIQLDQPDLVIDAIREMMDAIRK